MSSLEKWTTLSVNSKLLQQAQKRYDPTNAISLSWLQTSGRGCKGHILTYAIMYVTKHANIQRRKLRQRVLRKMS
jgi:hypothetical protein